MTEAATAEKILNRPVLVLNQRWVALTTMSVKEAIGLVAKGSARLMDPAGVSAGGPVTWNDVSRAKQKLEGEVIRSQRLSLVPPEVIVLTSYAGIGQRSVVFSRKNLFQPDKSHCHYCGVTPGAGAL